MSRVSLNPQFLQYDPICDSGINVGYNNKEQTVGIGESKRYSWKAYPGERVIFRIMMPAAKAAGKFVCEKRMENIFFAKFTWSFMKQITYNSENGYCYHVSVIGYTLFAGKGKTVMKQINELSKLAGISKRTLQYYDDEGIVPAKRSETSHRLYDEEALETIWQVMLYKEMGFRLNEIKQLLVAQEDMKKEYFRQKIGMIQSQITKFKEQMEFILFIQTCGMPSIPKECERITYINSIVEIKKRIALERKI